MFYMLYEKHEGLIVCPFCRDVPGNKCCSPDYGRGKKFKFKQQYYIAIHKHVNLPFHFSKPLYILTRLTHNIISIG